jgi:hypothetical protein
MVRTELVSLVKYSVKREENTASIQKREPASTLTDNLNIAEFQRFIPHNTFQKFIDSLTLQYGPARSCLKRR